ncbi:MAG: mutL [Clostridia bacterium]|jgi:DNA mismatch repair protein MutL|nr:mutL [Clostridia bacterium]
MGKIKLLDEATINKIAAGEVIERPSSIVKELVENSIDAKAAAITIEINNGGKSFISVSDNGSGIVSDDLDHVFERHATSKIDDAEDLFHIFTLGFRGEAMASIAAISEVEMQTRTESEDFGSYILIKGGKILDRKSIGFPVGTTITVRNLFYNTPAREKFLKSDISEQGHIVDVIQKLAMVNTAVSFKLIVEGKTVLHTPGNGDLLSVLTCIYGKNTPKAMMRLDYNNPMIHIDGYIGKPEIARGNSTYMIFSVNNRIIRNKMLGEAVKQAYKGLLMNNKFPFVVLNLMVQTDKIDVNVHPTKAEIKFSDDRSIFSTIYTAVKSALAGGDLTYGSFGAQEFTTEPTAAMAPQRVYEAPTPAIEIPDGPTSNERSLSASRNHTEKDSEQQSFLQAGVSYKAENINHSFYEQQKPTAVTKPAYSTVQQPLDRPNQLENLSIIGLLFHTYILTQDNSNFYIIDQHAAHERINYEYLMSKYHNNDIAIQPLMLPLVIELSPKEAFMVKDSFETFERLGFEMEWFGDNTIAIRSVPIVMGEPCSGDFFNEILDSLESSHKSVSPLEKIVISMACKSSIKAGTSITLEEMQELVRRLSMTKTPYTCPHGRPTIISMSQYEIEKKFKRVL